MAEKVFAIEDDEGGFIGYVRGKDDVEAFGKVLDHFAGCCPDKYMISEITEGEVKEGELML